MKTSDGEDTGDDVVGVVIGLFVVVFGFIGYTAVEAWATYVTRLPC